MKFGRTHHWYNDMVTPMRLDRSEVWAKLSRLKKDDASQERERMPSCWAKDSWNRNLQVDGLGEWMGNTYTQLAEEDEMRSKTLDRMKPRKWTELSQKIFHDKVIQQRGKEKCVAWANTICLRLPTFQLIIAKMIFRGQPSPKIVSIFL